MTEPSLHTTFDTSLVDLQTGHSSFSTTNSDPSLYNQASAPEKTLATSPAMNDGQHAAPPPQTQTSRLLYLPTVDAYDAWASVYDTDGNMLQALDDIQLAKMFPKLMQLVLANITPEKTTIRVADVGCGTGRNTMKLLSYAWPPNFQVEIVGEDASAGMLEIARAKLATAHANLSESVRNRMRLRFTQRDFLRQGTGFAIDTISPADAVISTLVLEHLPLPVYFSTLKTAVSPGGYALVTNMHGDMGVISQAGFVQVDPETGEKVKVRPTSYAHGVKETINAAIASGFQLVSDVKEMAVTEDIVEELGERGKKWLGVKVWYGMILRRM